MNEDKKIIYKKIWLVRWHAHGNHAATLLKKYSPQGEIIDILSSRKSFEYIEEHAKDLYRIFALSFSEKIPFTHYIKGEKYKKIFFSHVGISRYYKSEWYKKLVKIDAENPSKMLSSESREKWKEAHNTHPRYVTVGSNPSLEIREVFNFSKSEDEKGNIIFSWDELNNSSVNESIVYEG